MQEKKVGWYAVLADPQMPVTSPLLDQAQHALERKLYAMQGFHWFLTLQSLTSGGFR